MKTIIKWWNYYWGDNVWCTNKEAQQAKNKGRYNIICGIRYMNRKITSG